MIRKKSSNEKETKGEDRRCVGLFGEYNGQVQLVREIDTCKHERSRVLHVGKGESISMQACEVRVCYN